MNKKLIKETIDTLNCWKHGFLQGSDYTFEKDLGMVEISDQLDGIRQDGHECYASFLFNQLTKEEKSFIQSELDFFIDFDELRATYDLD